MVASSLLGSIRPLSTNPDSKSNWYCVFVKLRLCVSRVPSIISPRLFCCTIKTSIEPIDLIDVAYLEKYANGRAFTLVEHRKFIEYNRRKKDKLQLFAKSRYPRSERSAPEDELIQTPSLSNALRQLSASKNSRKALVVTTTTDTQAIPGGIQTLQINRANLLKAVVELRNQYRLEFESSSPSASVEVVLKPPRGLPPLQPNFLAPH
jgi:hypothetical protein